MHASIIYIQSKPRKVPVEKYEGLNYLFSLFFQFLNQQICSLVIITIFIYVVLETMDGSMMNDETFI